MSWHLFLTLSAAFTVLFTHQINPIPRTHEILLIMRIILIVNAILYFLVTVIFVDLFWFLLSVMFNCVVFWLWAIKTMLPQLNEKYSVIGWEPEVNNHRQIVGEILNLKR